MATAGETEQARPVGRDSMIRSIRPGTGLGSVSVQRDGHRLELGVVVERLLAELAADAATS